MQVLSVNQVEEVSGGDWGSAMGASGTAFGIGVATFGTSWGSMAVGAAFAASPIGVAAMVGLAVYAGYQMY